MKRIFYATPWGCVPYPKDEAHFESDDELFSFIDLLGNGFIMRD